MRGLTLRYQLLLGVRVLTAAVFFTATARAGAGSDPGLTPLEYRNPGLAVDLGVGLWAWPVPADADGDGDFDLLVSCPDKPSNGVWFFENATGDTRRQRFPVFRRARRLSSTVHYVMPSYLDGPDGKKTIRVLSPGFEYPDFLTRGLETRRAVPVAGPIHEPRGTAPGARGDKMRHRQWRYVDYDDDGRLDLVAGIEDWSDYGWDNGWDSAGRWTRGPLHGFVYWLRNGGSNQSPRYQPATPVLAEGKPVDTFGCPSPNFEDFDGDGDLDLLCGEFLDSFTYFENRGTRSEPRYSTGVRLLDPERRPLSMDLEMIVPIAFDWDRDGDLDLVVGDEDGRVALVENTGRLVRGVPSFRRPRYFQQEADTLKSGALATPVGFDWDGDGDIDLVSGNTAGYLEWFQNLSGPGVAKPRWAHPVRLQAGGHTFREQAGANGSIQGPAEAKWGYTTLSIADWDLDGKPDIVYNSILGKVRWLRNVGSRRKPRLEAPRPIEVDWNGTPPVLEWGWLRPAGHELLTQWRTTPVVHDFTRDGLPDLAMLDTEGYLALFTRRKAGGSLRLSHPQRVFMNDGDGQPLRLTQGRAGASGRRKIAVTDWNGDGLPDLLLNSANADLWLQTPPTTGSNGGSPTLRFRRSGPLSSRNIEGHDVSPTTVDFDDNGIPDFVGGAEDGRLYFLPNPRGR